MACITPLSFSWELRDINIKSSWKHIPLMHGNMRMSDAPIFITNYQYISIIKNELYRHA